MNIPNQLTLLRIILIPVFVLVYYLPYSWSNLVACIIFSLAGITDVLDGYLARKLNQTSSLGAFLDPVADKLMIAVALVLLVRSGTEVRKPNRSFSCISPVPIPSMKSLKLR